MCVFCVCLCFCLSFFCVCSRVIGIVFVVVDIVPWWACCFATSVRMGVHGLGLFGVTTRADGCWC